MAMEDSLRIEEVKTKRDLKKFIEFPYNLYKNDPYWVPQLKTELKFILSEKNPFWKHAKKALFLAVREGEVVGRVSASIDYNFIEFQNEKAGFFGFFECIEDYAVAENLMNTAVEWLKREKMKIMRGPMNPSTNDELSFLLEGFDSSPCIMMSYNPRYYLDFMEKFGMKKARDLYAFMLKSREMPVERLERVAARLGQRLPGLEITAIDFNNYENEAKKVEDIYNRAWEKNWGFVPWTSEEFYSNCKRLKSLFVSDVTLFAKLNGVPIGMLIAIPDYNQVLKRIRGKLTPLGIIKFLYYRNKINALRLMVMGVVKEYRNRGIEELMFLHATHNAVRLGFDYTECSWVLEDNMPAINSVENMGGKLYKKYRIYEKKI